MVVKDLVQREGEIRSRLFHQNLKKQNIAMLFKKLKSTEKDAKCTNSFFKINMADINLEKTSSHERAHTYTYRKKTKKQRHKTPLKRISHCDLPLTVPFFPLALITT